MDDVDVLPVALTAGAVTALAAGAFVVSVGYGVLLPVLPGWLASLEPSFPASTIANHVGNLSGIYMLGVFGGALAAGHLSDRIGRRPVLLSGLVVFLLSLLASAHVRSLASLHALRFLAGFSGAAVVPVAAALIADSSSPTVAPRRLAFLGAASLVGFLVGPAIVSLPQLTGIDVRWNVSGSGALFSFATHATIGLGMLVFVAAFRIRPGAPRVPTIATAGASASGGARVSLYVLLALNFAILLGLGGFEVGLALYGSQRLQLDTVQISLMFAECSVVMLLISGVLFLTPLWRSFTVRTVLVVSLGAMVGGFVLLDRSTGYGSVLVAVALVAAGSGMAMPTLTYSAASNAARLGSTMGQLTAAGSLGQAIGSFAGGWMFALSAARTFLVGAVVMVVALVIAWIGARGLADKARTGGAKNA